MPAGGGTSTACGGYCLASASACFLSWVPALLNGPSSTKAPAPVAEAGAGPGARWGSPSARPPLGASRSAGSRRRWMWCVGSRAGS
uniref:Putative secreted protein n=1 Tax=Ixodes ricinus TaxID=34613 RepID=A0A6B0U0Z8_IXORI